MSACPSELDLARAISVEDPAISAHLASCSACAHTWDATTRAIEGARRVPVRVPSADRREEMRTAILAASARGDARDTDDAGHVRSSKKSSPRARWYAGATIALAAGVALVLARSERAPTHAHGTIVAHPNARYTTTRAPDEIVTLHDGTIDVEVSPIHAGERFRVMTADTEIEVRGTAFEVVAELGHMTRVQVRHGVVEVRPHGAAMVTLTSGQSWAAPRTAAAPHESSTVVAPDAPSMTMKTKPPMSPPAPRRTASPKPATIGSPSTTTTGSPASTATAPRAPEALAYDEAWAAMREGDFEHAASAFARVSILDPDGPLSEDASYWYAVALARAKRAEAIAAFRDLLSRYPHSTHAGEANAMLGWLLVEAKQPAEARRRFDAAKDDANSSIRESARRGLAALDAR